jgi:phage baseplate assembly protein W
MGATGLAVVEQDSVEEITACVYALIATERGSRLEEPDYGVEDASFDQFPLEEAIDEWLVQIGVWEPRAKVRTTQELEDLVARVTVEVGAAQ